MGGCVDIEKDIQKENVRIIKGKSAFIEESSGSVIDYRIKIYIEVYPYKMPDEG
jgi:hypothetical protein